MASGVLSIVPKKIGEGGLKSGASVKRVQQLLWMAGYTTVGTPDGGWGKNTTAAWMEYQEKLVFRSQPFIAGGDPENRLFYLALAAGVLMPLTGGIIGAKGLRNFFDSCVALRIPYGWEHDGKKYGNGTMMTWGYRMNGNTAWGICTKPGGVDSVLFDLKVPLALNCTAFAQAALSIWHHGNLHNPQYRSDQMVGHFTNLSQTRYGYVPLPGTKAPTGGAAVFPGLYSSVEELEDELEAGVLYHFALCSPNGSIKHDTVLLDGEVYESNSDGPPYVYKTALQERWKRARNANRFAIVSKPG
ncbi:MAG: peptidoglycan-binding domain-containing protein [Gemmatimonadaceae bacterium]